MSPGKWIEVFEDGQFGDRTFREVRKRESLDGRSPIEMNVTGRTTSEIHVQYRDIGIYMIGHLEIHASNYIAHGEEAISLLTNLRRGEEQIVDKRLRGNGVADKDTVGQKRLEMLLARYGAISPRRKDPEYRWLIFTRESCAKMTSR